MAFNITITTEQLGRQLADAGVPQEAARALALDLLPLSPEGIATVMAAYEARKRESQAA